MRSGHIPPWPGRGGGRHSPSGGFLEASAGVPPVRGRHPHHSLGRDYVGHPGIAGAHVPGVIVVPPSRVVYPDRPPPGQVARVAPPGIEVDGPTVVVPSQAQCELESRMPVRVPPPVPTEIGSAPPRAVEGAIGSVYAITVPPVSVIVRVVVVGIVVIVRIVGVGPTGAEAHADAEPHPHRRTESNVEAGAKDRTRVPVGGSHSYSDAVVEARMERGGKGYLGLARTRRQGKSQDDGGNGDETFQHGSSWLDTHPFFVQGSCQDRIEP